MDNSTKPIVTMSGVSKAFGPVSVLEGVNLEIRPGEILALVGENGAGKSTLLSVVTGMHQASSGTTHVLGQEISGDWNPLKARKAGVSSVHQELSLNPYQTVAENIFMAQWPTKIGAVDRRKMDAQVKQLLQRVCLDVAPNAKVKDLDLGAQQLVELAKALRTDPQVLVLDEATSALDEDQVKAVFRVAGQVADEGGAVIMVSHRMQELFTVSNRMLVLKDGVVTGQLETAKATEAEVIKLMLGRELSDLFPPKSSAPAGNPALEAKAIPTLSGEQTSISLYPGKIIGVGGLQGQGQREVLRGIFGLGDRAVVATIHGKNVRITKPRTALSHQIAFVPDDRKREGVQVDRAVRDNLALPSLRDLASKLLGNTVSRRAEQSLVDQLVAQLQIKVTAGGQLVRFLSGGNQQKIALAKWLPGDPQILLLAEPTRGIDVGTKREIYHLLRALADKGLAVLVTSGDTMELVGLCDEVIVMYEGKEVERLTGDELTEETLVRASVTGSANGGTNE